MSFDPQTGEVVDDGPAGECARCHSLAQVIETMKLDLQLVERDLRDERRSVAALKAELKAQLEEVPERQLMKTAFLGWINATGRNPKRTKLGPAREKVLLARIREGQSFERIMRAVTIGVRAATVSDRDAERLALIRVMRDAIEMVTPAEAAQLRSVYKATLGRGTKVYDDIEFICRNEVNLERFADMADALEPLDPTKSIDAGESER